MKKLHFSTKHNLYYIFRTLKKFPSYQTAGIYIHPDHEFFENLRWGKQLKELLEKETIKAVCIVDTHKTEKYFK